MPAKTNLKYPNLTILFSVLFLTYLLYRAGSLNDFVNNLGYLEYSGIFLCGMFFVSTFTVVPASIVLALFAEQYGINTVSFLAGLGGVLGDFLIFRFVKDGLVTELKEIFQKVSGDRFAKFHWIIHTKYFVWISPVIGALIIASPLPDELGVGLLGIYKMSNAKFLILSFFLNTIGIFLILSAVEALF